MLTLTNNSNHNIMLTEVNKRWDLNDNKLFRRIFKDDICLKKSGRRNQGNKYCKKDEEKIISQIKELLQAIS